MKIKIRDIPPDGLDLKEALSPEELGMNGEEFGCVAPVHVDAHLQLVGETVIAKVNVQAVFVCSCSRCLREFNLERNESFMFDYFVEPKTESVDVGEDIRQEMILGMSLKSLCREDCKGLCPDCGGDLNNGGCQCNKGRGEKNGRQMKLKRLP